MNLSLFFGFLDQLNWYWSNFYFDEILRDWIYFDFFIIFNQLLDIFKVNIITVQLPNVLSFIFWH